MLSIHEANIWQIFRRIYNISAESPTSENQIELVKEMARYVLNPVTPEQQKAFDKAEFEKPYVMADSTAPRKRGRPRKS